MNWLELIGAAFVVVCCIVAGLVAAGVVTVNAKIEKE